MSAFTSPMALSWSGVSSKGNDASNSCCHGVSAAKARPSACTRLWYSTTSSWAISATAARTLALLFCHSPPPSRLRLGESPPV